MTVTSSLSDVEQIDEVRELLREVLRGPIGDKEARLKLQSACLKLGDELRRRSNPIPDSGERVRALEWTQVIPGRMFADLYMIERLYLDDWRLFLRANNHGDRPRFLAGPFSLEEAKAAAQADFNARIMSCLNPAPASVKVDGLPDPADVERWNDQAEAEACARLAAVQHDPKLVAALTRVRDKLEATPEALRGPFKVDGLKPFAAPASVEVTGEVGECRYCANTGWFYGDPDLQSYCGCAFGRLREELTAVPTSPTAVQITDEMVERAAEAVFIASKDQFYELFPKAAEAEWQWATTSEDLREMDRVKARAALTAALEHRGV
jgi:hypothetical protein